MNLNEFKNIPALYRPAPFWSWNDKLCNEELMRQIDEMAEKGWGSYFMHSRVGLVTGYLSQEWFEHINACAEKAKETGTYAWLYDEDKWPSGFAGGEVSQNPDFRNRALVLLESGQETEYDEILETFLVNGVNYSIAKRVSPMGSKWFNGASYVDLMNPDAVKKFIECTHERYKQNCGQYFGKEIPGIFTDEPCFLMNNDYNVPVMPWSEYLPDFFEKRKGYSITSYLKELFFDVNDYQKIRYDFFESATALFLESFTKQYYNWCEENGLIMTGHFMCEDSLTLQTQWIGNAMSHYEFMHWPGIDKLDRFTKRTITVKQVSSAVEQLGKERAFCEVFGCIGQQCAYQERKWIADWEAVLGVSFVNHHLSLYSMRGERKRDFPANLFYQQPWWSEEKMFADYVGRLCEIAAYGKRDAKILIIHPVGSAWSEYSPISKKSTAYDEPFQKLTDMLIEENLDFHYGDESILKNNASIYNGNIKIGEYEYTAVVVPPSLTLMSDTIKLLSEFGGKLIFVHPLPARVDGSLSDNIIADNAIKVTSVSTAVNMLSDMFCNKVKTTDLISGKNAKKLICCVKETSTDKVVLFANTEESREINARLEISESRTPYLLDLASGDVYEIPYTRQNGTVTIDAKFYFGGSLAVMFRDVNTRTLPAPMFTDTGVSFIKEVATIAIGTNYRTALNEENVLPINKVTLYLDGKLVLDNQPIAKAWHEYFYKAEDGTPFAAEYKFNVNGDLPEEMFAVVECAQNLDKITVNGTSVNPLRNKGDVETFDVSVNYKDVNHVRIPINGLARDGVNILRIEGVKINNIIGQGRHSSVKNFKEYNSTEVETVYITGDFSVEGKDDCDFYIVPKSDSSHRDITSTGAPFYSGKATVKCKADLSAVSGKTYIKLSGVKASCAKVFIAETELACKYLMPFIYEIPENINKGIVEISIEIAGTLFNMNGPGWIDGILNDTGVGPETFVDFDRYTEKTSLLPFGIERVEVVGLL